MTPPTAGLPTPDVQCPACPTSVRDLFACAHNVRAAWNGDPIDGNRLNRKMHELGESLAAFQPVVDAHFAARDRDETSRTAGRRHGQPAPERRRAGTVRVCDLLPGDLVDNGMGMSATLLGWSTPHPRYPGLALVLWRMHHADGFSVDALHPEQEVGELVERDDEQRFLALTAALPYETNQEGRRA